MFELRWNSNIIILSNSIYIFQKQVRPRRIHFASQIFPPLRWIQQNVAQCRGWVRGHPEWWWRHDGQAEEYDWFVKTCFDTHITISILRAFDAPFQISLAMLSPTHFLFSLRLEYCLQWLFPRKDALHQIGKFVQKIGQKHKGQEKHEWQIKHFSRFECLVRYMEVAEADSCTTNPCEPERRAQREPICPFLSLDRFGPYSGNGQHPEPPRR